MTVNDYIISNIKDPLLKVLEIGPWHGMLSDALYENGIDIHASEVMKDASIWSREPSVPYPCYNLSYTESLKLKNWDIVVATNVIHHLRHPFLFLEELTKNSKRIMISSACITERPFNRLVGKWGTDDIASVFPMTEYQKFLEDQGWTVLNCEASYVDFKNRQSWIIDALI
jgi:2-polyprenyl-3-methyl-5-hydroxy-6-metoxy-1,4-benzoquinol methylase